jgi:hypothetical protein
MYNAIINDRVDFVKLFIENGFQVKKFLTYRRLIKLYNDVSEINSRIALNILLMLKLNFS